jgi:hypothetical protein
MKLATLVAGPFFILPLAGCVSASSDADDLFVRVEFMRTGINAGIAPNGYFLAEGFDAARAQVSRGDLDHERASEPVKAFDRLSEPVTTRIRTLAAELSASPEQLSWVGCELSGGTIRITGDDTYYDIWITDGGKQTHYRRASRLAGRVGKIAALAMGRRPEPSDTDCLPGKE